MVPSCLLHITVPIQALSGGDHKDEYEEGLILFYFLRGASSSTQHPRAQLGQRCCLKNNENLKKSEQS